MDKNLIFAGICVAGLLSFTACSDDEPGAKGNTEFKEIALSRAEADMVQSQSEFAYKLFTTTLGETSTQGNVVVAPYSLGCALAMTANAAEGQVALEISRALGCAGTEDIEALNGLYKRLTAELITADNRVDLVISNSAWLDPKYKFVDSFSNTLATYYDAKTYQADFRTQAGVDKFNEWCSKATNGAIKKVMDSPDNIDFAITNANCFHGKWTDPFEEKNTHKAIFNNADRSISDVEMMKSYENWIVYSGTNFKMVTLPYGNKAFRMTLLLPDEGVGVATVASSLVPESLDKANLAFCGNYSLELPKFKTSYSNHSTMMSILAKLGMPTAMNTETGILSRLATLNGQLRDMNITKVLHDVVIEVDESGSKAAAVSVVAGMDGASYVEPKGTITFDRPFIFIINEVSTGTVLFMGAINRL